MVRHLFICALDGRFRCLRRAPVWPRPLSVDKCPSLMTYAAVPQMHRTGKKSPADDGAKDSHAWGYTWDNQSEPHPFTFAGQHVQIGGGVGRFWGLGTIYTLTTLIDITGKWH